MPAAHGMVWQCAPPPAHSPQRRQACARCRGPGHGARPPIIMPAVVTMSSSLVQRLRASDPATCIISTVISGRRTAPFPTLSYSSPRPAWCYPKILVLMLTCASVLRVAARAARTGRVGGAHARRARLSTPRARAPRANTRTPNPAGPKRTGPP